MSKPNRIFNCAAGGKNGGGSEIRTHGSLTRVTGFQDRLLKPLGHPSEPNRIYYPIDAHVCNTYILPHFTAFVKGFFEKKGKILCHYIDSVLRAA